MIHDLEVVRFVVFSFDYLERGPFEIDEWKGRTRVVAFDGASFHGLCWKKAFEIGLLL